MYFGGLADQHRLDLYDGSQSLQGLSRTLSIIGHYYVTGQIIAQAPHSAMPVHLLTAEEGSFKQQVAVAVISGIVLVPFTVFATRMMEHWIPTPQPELAKIVGLLTEQNKLLRQQMKMADKDLTAERDSDDAETEIVDRHIEQNTEKVQILRSVTSNSFRNIFRPVGRSVDAIGIIGGTQKAPTAIVDQVALGRIEAEQIDDEQKTITAVVNSFSRTSKTGLGYTRDLNISFRFEYKLKSPLPREDDFSWSQFTGKPIRMTGKFVRFFDGSIKKFLVSSAQRVTNELEVREYFEQPID